MKFLDVLEEVLKSDERFIGENDQVIKTKVADAARNADSSLIKSLLQNEILRDSFFTKVDDVYVFDKVKFIWIIESKEFLPDSYTLYKNKIGLVDEQNNLISQKQDVSLVWPYKDCVLEGGQTKEDQKREEIFYNETLAPDEVNRLLAPKVLGNAKRYTADGVEKDIVFDDKDNLIIKGNNLLGLSSLLKKFEGQVNFIYIDPPFNTEGDSFQYNDRFKQSTWLTFFKNRLELAKRLLSDKGVIFVHLDWNESHYAKIILDEVFGKDNFLNEIVWCFRERETSKRFFNRKHNNIFFYVKNKDADYPFYYDSIREEYSEVTIQKFKYTDEDGRKYRLRTKDGDSDPAEENENTYRQYLDETSGPLPRDWFVMPFLNQSSSERVGFNTQKPESLLEKLMLATTKEGDLVLDYHVGSGTTIAAAQKMNRRYIGIEQMDYIENITVKRMVKILKGDQSGISINHNWQGGGSFVYCELLEDNQSLINEVQDASDSSTVKSILNRATDNGKIVPSVLPSDLKKTEEEFDELSLEGQKTLVLELLDKNKLYVNLSDLDDEDANVNEADKTFTKSFYDLD